MDDLVLAIETSSGDGGLALGRAGAVVATRTLEAERRHAAALLPACQELLREGGFRPADVGVMAFSRGPGSFTGLRLAATAARLWCSATACRAVAVDTLEVVARNALAHAEPPARIAAILDARRGQLFGALYERTPEGEMRVVAEAGRHDAGAWLAALPRPCAVLGAGVAAHREALAAAGLTALDEGCWRPDARQVLQIAWRRAQAGQFCSLEEIVPLYLRPPECEEVYEQRRAEARQRRGE